MILQPFIENALWHGLSSSKQKEKKINIYSKYIIHKKIFSSEEYFGLKDFFKKIIEVENSEIILEKI